jgi:predicted thioesterase
VVDDAPGRAGSEQPCGAAFKPDQGQVGVSITVRHMGPTPIGKSVRAEAELVAIDRRRLSFKVKVFEDTEQVGESEHDRFIVDLDKYFARLKQKLGNK